MSDNRFPENRWGNPDSTLARLAAKFAATKPGSWVIRKLTPLDRAVMQRTGSRYTVLGPLGLSTLLLTTTGRKSGRPRVSPLLYLHDCDRIALVGSNFGQEKHPAWTANLLADPRAKVTLAGQTIDVLATPLEGPERDDYYRRFESMLEVYSAYKGRTGREIRVFTLERIN
ncbi:Deazaflavin-dependent nitroreductase [Mycobacteroides abscessus subsp. massiliense]|uniref:nitroreductase/quinone reductase family protein n=1 Tax=Mycobacteroides abscessus TaxID=36809 RepID=UPI0009A578BB|nr:nitroreductase/quinone reductase family protein [Mycobacteroides abscessus]SKD27348.1 Deazaflavin-dependent nitroreductase [Mycobacteroides abscessus subsp. massiliense]SKD27692.1 Deazaflavin-dependent nitroreductase [Mycobacteroides abscessus subsp. massiliense]SKD57262.1 Deazaflavin-dependent nitroreductase [Mycobacteroides abscessus subsp. massiliense]SKD60449.1 Deazaflavin-dependent nitroreductase [Mycobacteroides abscessus subsp. massiliense]SKD68898.1 Deazaflavin-dependent nitroreduct